MIQKAKVKKAYAKIKSQELASVRKSVYMTTEGGDETIQEKTEDRSLVPTSSEPHPDRVAMINEPSPEPAPKSQSHTEIVEGRQKRERKPKRSAFAKEIAIAEQRRKEAEARQQERRAKQNEREAMARAKRPDQFGKRRLGRESKVLLGRVQRIVGQL